MNKKEQGGTGMRERVREPFCESLMSTIGQLQKEFMRFHAQFEFGGLSRLHIGILGVLSRNGELPVSAIGEKIHTSKPQMTLLLDKLESLDLVRRSDNASDRRVTTVGMTDKGRGVLAEALGVLRRDVNAQLEVLSDRELEEFTEALGVIRKVLAKL
jgi:DNA-binding MarR family transcriptional regulator